MSNQMMPLLYKILADGVGRVLCKELYGCEYLSFTSDLWTGKNQKSFETFTVHYVDSNFQMRRYFISCTPFKEAHTAENISNNTNK